MNRLLFFIFVTFFCLMSCNKNQEQEKDTMLKGKAAILVDESVISIVEELKLVFETQYDAKLELLAKPEKVCSNDLINKKASIAIFTRELNKKEKDFFSARKIIPKTTVFAKDAIVLITSKNTKIDSLDFNEVIAFLQKKNSLIKGIVFDNPNSSSTRFFLEQAKLTELSKETCYSLENTKKVIEYISKNENMIGVVGINEIIQPTKDTRDYVEKIKMLSIKYNANQYIYPSQETLMEGTYPLARLLYIINCQGYSGLGMGFASFIAGEKGQRIISVAGLSPVRVPGRNYRIKN